MTESRREKIVTEEFLAVVENLEHHASKFHKLAYEFLRVEQGGVCDKKVVRRFIARHLYDNELSEFLKKTDKFPFGFHPDQPNAVWFGDEFAKEVVNWLGANVCIDLYDLLVTKKAYARLKKFVARAEDVECLEDNTVTVWPKQWNK